MYFLRGIAKHEDGRLVVRTTGEQGSGILRSMVLANCLIIIPEQTSVVERGEKVTIQTLDPTLAMSTEPDYLLD